MPAGRPLLMELRFVRTISAPVIPIRTREMIIPVISLVRNWEGVYGSVAACIKPMQMVLMHKLRIAPPMHHRTIPFLSLYPMKTNPAAVKIANR